LSKYYNYKSDPDYEYSPKHNSRHHSSEALAKLPTQPQGQSSLAPPKKNERRHSLGGKLAAALHL